MVDFIISTSIGDYGILCMCHCIICAELPWSNELAVINFVFCRVCCFSIL